MSGRAILGFLLGAGLLLAGHQLPVTEPAYKPVALNALTTTTTVSGVPGRFGGYMFINLNSSPAYIQVFDTTGAVTLGTTTPTFVIPIPANSTAANGAGANISIAAGINLVSGCKVAATTTATGASTVATAVTGFVCVR